MIIEILDLFFQAIYLVLIVRIALSWIPHDKQHPIIEWIYKVTTPILKPFQQMIPPIGGMDVSPIVAFFAIGFLKRILFSIL
ncbi:hypothetical protein DID75_03235 [Candidatus Marinamargulisbacteria bacterium SCGC AG-410-N11]|nr:hypothetical protein DID75_03235 [Candidatus Marinamargulisbacteria bacterium SCGC AG-410-N11]